MKVLNDVFHRLDQEVYTILLGNHSHIAHEISKGPSDRQLGLCLREAPKIGDASDDPDPVWGHSASLHGLLLQRKVCREATVGRSKRPAFKQEQETVKEILAAELDLIKLGRGIMLIK